MRVQGRTGLQEMWVKSDATADEFLAEAQEAGLVPRSGVSNVVVLNESGDRIDGGDLLATAIGGGVVSVVWDEFDAEVESLCKMGFERENAAAALRAADGCIDMAVELLISGGDFCYILLSKTDFCKLFSIVCNLNCTLSKFEVEVLFCSYFK